MMSLMISVVVHVQAENDTPSIIEVYLDIPTLEYLRQ